MGEDSSFLLKLLALVLLILTNGFFVAVEFAAVTARRSRLETLAEQGHATARLVLKWVENPDRLVAAAQIGITIASLALGYVGENTFAHLLEPWLSKLHLPVEALTPLLGALPLILSLTVVTGLHVVFGEQTPKIIALRAPERVVLLLARPMEFCARLFHPLVVLLDSATQGVVRLLGMEPIASHHTIYSIEELKRIVQESQEKGVLEIEEREMLDAIFDLGSKPVRQVMVPRTEMICIPAEASLDDAADLAARYPLTKFPVYEGDLDHIIGILHVQDLVRALREGEQATSVRNLLREALVVPESVRVADLLKQFRQKKTHIAILLDEYGGTAGLVTLEDLLEEIVGDVEDAFDIAEPGIQELPDGSALISGLTPIDEVNEHFGLHLSDPYYDTIAGYVLGRLGRIARVGDEVEANGVRLRVEAMDGLRIARLSLFPIQNPSTPVESSV